MSRRVRVIDLSLPLMNYSMDTHEQTIQYFDHAEVARQRAKTYDIPADRFPVPHLHTATEVVTLTTHAGTVALRADVRRSAGAHDRRNTARVVLWRWCSAGLHAQARRRGDLAE